MKIIPTPLEGCFELLPEVYQDTREFYGNLCESTSFRHPWRARLYSRERGDFIYGVIRGMHYQAPPFAQAKLIRVISGKIIDIAIDLRPKSTTF